MKGMFSVLSPMFESPLSLRQTNLRESMLQRIGRIILFVALLGIQGCDEEFSNPPKESGVSKHLTPEKEVVMKVRVVKEENSPNNPAWSHYRLFLCEVLDSNYSYQKQGHPILLVMRKPDAPLNGAFLHRHPEIAIQAGGRYEIALSSDLPQGWKDIEPEFVVSRYFLALTDIVSRDTGVSHDEGITFPHATTQDVNTTMVLTVRVTRELDFASIDPAWKPYRLLVCTVLDANAPGLKKGSPVNVVMRRPDIALKGSFMHKHPGTEIRLDGEYRVMLSGRLPQGWESIKGEFDVMLFRMWALVDVVSERAKDRREE